MRGIASERHKWWGFRSFEIDFERKKIPKKICKNVRLETVKLIGRSSKWTVDQIARESDIQMHRAIPATLSNSFELFLKAPSTPKIVHRDAKFTSFLWPNRTANAKQEFQVWKPPMEKISHGNSWSPPEFPEENPKFPTEPSGNSNQKPRSFFYGNRSLLGKPPEVSPAGSTWNHLKLFTFYETKKFLDVFLEAKAILRLFSFWRLFISGSSPFWRDSLTFETLFNKALSWSTR